MESGAELSALQDTATVKFAEEIRAAKKQRNRWWKEANCTRLKEDLVNSMYPYLRLQCDEDFLVLGLDPVPKQTLFVFLRRIDRKPIRYENAFPMKNRALLSENQVKYVEDIIFKRDTAKLGISSKEVIQVTS